MQLRHVRHTAARVREAGWGEGVFPDGAHTAADGGAQYRPPLEEQVSVEMPGQVIMQDLV